MRLTMAWQTEFPQQVMFQGKCTCVCVCEWFIEDLFPTPACSMRFCLTCLIYPCVLFSPARLGAQIIWTVPGSPPPAPLAPLPTWRGRWAKGEKPRPDVCCWLQVPFHIWKLLPGTSNLPGEKVSAHLSVFEMKYAWIFGWNNSKFSRSRPEE